MNEYMYKYYYTYKNEYDVTDVGCIEAVSDKECRCKIKQIGIKAISIYLNESWIGLEFAFSNNTKFKYRYRDANNKAILLSKAKDWRFYVSFGVLLIVFLSLPLSIEWLASMPFIYFLAVFSLFLMALVSYFFCYYELEMDVASKVLIKRKKFITLNCWRKKIDVSNAKIHLLKKIACNGNLWSFGFEELYVTQIELRKEIVAISSSCQEDSEVKLAKTISEALSLPLLLEN